MRGAVDEPLLQRCPLPAVPGPLLGGERPEVELLDPAPALGELGGRAARAYLLRQTVVLGTEPAPERGSADNHGARHRGHDGDHYKDDHEGDDCAC